MLQSLLKIDIVRNVREIGIRWIWIHISWSMDHDENIPERHQAADRYFVLMDQSPIEQFGCWIQYTISTSPLGQTSPAQDCTGNWLSPSLANCISAMAKEQQTWAARRPESMRHIRAIQKWCYNWFIPTTIHRRLYQCLHPPFPVYSSAVPRRCCSPCTPSFHFDTLTDEVALLSAASRCSSLSERRIARAAIPE